MNLKPLIVKVGCMGCKNKIEFKRNVYEKQVVKCENCNTEIEIRPYKNSKVTMKNLSC